MSAAKCTSAKKGKPQGAGVPAAHYAVRVRATVRLSGDAARVRLTWPRVPCQRYTVFRRELGATRWPARPLRRLAGRATGCVDADRGLGPGRVYEYQVVRHGQRYQGYGYVCAALAAPLVEARGRLVLIVERGVAGALRAEIARLRQDLVGDGWSVAAHVVGRRAAPAAVKALIRAEWRAAPRDVRAVLLLGHVPVPYSGSLRPDGHKDHQGAWPADLYYGDLGGGWTDRRVRRVQKDPRTTNIPGDGKFDPSRLPPGRPALAVGRIDLHAMPAFRGGEIALLRRYLEKNHRYRHGRLPAARRALVSDHFGEFRGEAFAASAWRGFAPLVGAAATRTGKWLPHRRRQPLLLGYGCGPGGHTGCGGVGTTAGFAAADPGVLFTLLFGSYFGDWDCENAFLRAPLATRRGGLVCGWSGRPHWLLHFLGVGETVGCCALRTQRNDARRDYPGCGRHVNGVHVALMGDPTLRLHPVRPPSGLRAVAGSPVRLHWRRSPDRRVLGYHVYRAESAAGPFTRLTAEPVQGLVFTDAAPSRAARHYMVRAVRRETGPSGIYVNASQGIVTMATRRDPDPT